MSHYDWMNTWTGRKFWPLAPDDEGNVVDLVDVARALSNLCRYGGHCRFYSVAEHSVRLMRYFRARVAPREVLRAALLHDASEAYLSDVIRPVKYAPEFAFYLEVERPLQARIFRQFGLPEKLDPAIAAADSAIISDEGRGLIPHRAPEWQLGPGLGLELRDAGWMPRHAEDAFLDEASRLGLYAP